MSLRATPVETDSSVLVSSSQYLNHAGMRDFFSTHFLRKNGPDRLLFSDNAIINKALNDLRDDTAVDAWFERERKNSPPLDAWMTERHVSAFTVADLAKCPPDTVGGIYFRDVLKGIELDAGFQQLKTRSWYEYAMVRYTRNHDFDHILTGGAFTFPGEYVPIYALMTNGHNYLSAEFACFLGLRSGLANMRLLARAILYYPGSVWAFLSCMAQGIGVGLASAPLRLLKPDDYLHLRVEDARARAGIREAYDVPTEPWASAFLNPTDPDALADDAHLPYIKRGVREVPTTSSVPVSSSKYLNDPRMRAWTPVAMLRKAGGDYPDRLELHDLEDILRGLRDTVAVRALVKAAQAERPELAQPRGVASVTQDALAAAPSGSVGALLLQRLRRNDELNRLGDANDDDWSSLYKRIALAEETLAVVFGATGEALDGIMAGWAMATSLFRDIEPALAGELCVARIFGLLRFVARSQMHYPNSWIGVARAMRQGILIGQNSPALYSLPVASVLHLTPGEARERLGIRPWEAVDIGAASAAYGESELFAAAE